MNKVRVIADSHTRNFIGYDHIELNYNDSQTMFWASTHPFTEQLNGLDKKDLALFGFGEVDVRCLIYNQITEKGREEDEIIETLALNYVDNVSKLHDNFGIVNIIPPCKCWVNNNDGELPNPYGETFRGTDRERNRFTLKLNFQLSLLCMERRILLVDIYSELKDSEGFLPKQISDDGIHLQDTSKLIPVLKKYGLI